MALTHSVWGVDGVSLVESSTNGPAVRGSCLSTIRRSSLWLGGWVWNLVRSVGGGWFLARCWALRNQAPARVIRVGSVGWLLGV
jgi:hypothetical protein